jgi:hypothetical protein
LETNSVARTEAKILGLIADSWCSGLKFAVLIGTSEARLAAVVEVGP